MSKGSTAVPYRALDMLETRDGAPSNKDTRMTNVLLEAHGTEAAFIKRTGFAQSLTSKGIPFGATAFTDSSGAPKILSVNGGNAIVSYGLPGSSWSRVGDSEPLTLAGYGVVANVCIIFNGVLVAFVLSQGGSTPTKIYQSYDAKTWSLLTDTLWSGVGFSAAAIYGPVVCGGYIYIWESATNPGNVTAWKTSDGINWTNLGTSNLGTYNLNPTIFSIGGTIYAIGALSFTYRLSSTDGITFSQTLISTSVPGDYHRTCILGGVVYSIDPSKTNNSYKSSDNGVTWVSLGMPSFTARTAAGVTVHNNQIVVGGGEIAGPGTPMPDLWVSNDGATWERSFTNTTPSNLLGESLTWANGTQPVTVATRLYSFKGYLYALAVFPSGVSGNWYSKRSPSTPTAVSLSVSTTTAIPGFATSTSQYRPYDPIDFSQTLDRTKIAMKNSVGAWQMTVSSGAVVQVTDGDYPTTTVRGLAYLNGVFYVMDPNGGIYGSGTNDFTTWTALNKITAQSEPDGGACITKYGQYIIAFGNYTTEFFYDAGNATGSPLSSVQNGQFMVGCSNGDTVAQIEKTIFFVSQRKVQGQATGKGFGVSKLEGFNISDVSTEDVERVLNADGLFGAWATTVNFLGHDCYMMSLPTTGISLLYDTQSKMWSYINYQAQGNSKTVSALTCAAPVLGMTTGVATATCTAHGFSDGDPATIAGATPSGYNGTFNITYVDANTFTYPTATVLANATGTITARGYTATAFPLMMAFEFSGSQIFQNPDGGLYEIIDTLYQDNSAYIDTKIRTSRSSKGLKKDQNQKPKFISWADIVTDRVSANMLLRYTDDDYQTYSNYQSVSLSPKRSRITRLGRTIRRAWELRHTDNSAMRLQYMELGIEQGDE